MFTKEEKYAIGKEGYDKADTMANFARKYGTKYINGRNWQKAYAKSIVAELSHKYEVTKLCKAMQVNRSGFYKWQKRVNNPSEIEIKRSKDITLFLMGLLFNDFRIVLFFYVY